MVPGLGSVAEMRFGFLPGRAFSPLDEGPVGMSSGLFYALLLLGAILFLAAFFYSRRHRP